MENGGITQYAEGRKLQIVETHQVEKGETHSVSSSRFKLGTSKHNESITRYNISKTFAIISQNAMGYIQKCEQAAHPWKIQDYCSGSHR